ncbi:NADH-quinone oxidoreductase subunit J [Blochmannia endosymbiont of Camponotus sp. C-003]|uniref:NADH-quinone oxidoreductase subunit J n=1 Tax=unclassified Candidatus Blochmanniella TaxID=711328 RepID=UPI0020252307|nr:MULTISPECIES: NADH-quinone oxidoreductase subunit J [unclassified Candidatus Blochmannia]URJ23345.1 NADH-quinone oxidoreductase subunit J [Blochmannia endosymbiont of Camponotus sp. C-003]URJ28818.1 NADH-quinone oxidoreductase subunit J [Blochmannia endosymbiont of Camponotus sp. C-046]
MTTLFYMSGITAILSTVCVILHYHPMHALLYLIVSFLSISCNFFSLGASFAAFVEVIVYAGAIMILFVFAIMMLNMKTTIFGMQKKSRFFNPILCCGSVLLIGILFLILLYISFGLQDDLININKSVVDSKQVGVALFGPYILMVELASFLLLSSLISVFHLSQKHQLSDDCIDSI